MIQRSRWTGRVVLALSATLLAGSTQADDDRGDRRGRRDGKGRERLHLSVTPRSIDGTDREDGAGATHTRMLRVAPADYPGDGSGVDMITTERANPRTISNLVASQGFEPGNHRNLTNMLWLWGQFLDHDIDLTESHPDNGIEDVYSLDPGDPINVVFFNRSNYVPFGAETADSPRQQVNEITAFIDASNVYGSNAATLALLREGDGIRMRLDGNGLLPTDDAGHFLAGDVRSNENVALTAMHTLFVREHNRVAERIREVAPNASDEHVFQLARKIVGAEMQIITYREFLPSLLGPYAPRPWRLRRHDPRVDPSIANEFSTAFFRFGHTLLPTQLPLADGGGVPLREAFFNPELIAEDPALVERLLVGAATTECREFDNRIVDDVRNFLFGEPDEDGGGIGFGLDLATLNIQRGRDHGLPDYNTLRAAYGLRKARDFDDITSDALLREKLEFLYETVDNVDPWVGGLAEDPLPFASTGPLVTIALLDQFVRTAKGDPFFHAHDPDLEQKVVERVIDLDEVTLSQVIRWNTQLEPPRDVFRLGRPRLRDYLRNRRRN